MIHSSVELIPIEDLTPGEFQPRKHFDEEGLNELADSIKATGLIEPIIARLLVTPRRGAKYEIVAGERRWRASQRAGKYHIETIIREMSDEMACQVALTENINRADLNPVEIAYSLQQFIERFGYTQENLAQKIGMSRPAIANILRLLQLTEKVQRMIIENKLNMSHGKALASLSHLEQEEWARRCIAWNWSSSELEKEMRKAQKNTGIKKDPLSSRLDPDVQKLEREFSNYMGIPTLIIKEKDTYILKLRCSDLDILDGVLIKTGFKKKELVFG